MDRFVAYNPFASSGTTADSMTVDIATAVSTADFNAFDQSGDTILFVLTGGSAISSYSYYILV